MPITQIPRYADTVVIGGGTAGAAVAGLLAERGDQSVLLLEAGPDYGHLREGRWPGDLLDGRVLASTHDWSFTSAAAHGQPNHELQRAKVIGGCSAHNGCIAIWGSGIDYDGWASAGNDGWSTAEVVLYFERAMARLRVREYASEEVTPFHGACLEAMIATGIPRTADLNDLDEDVGAALAPVNNHQGIRWSAALAYLDPVRARSNFTIVGDALVDRINLRGSQAVSVSFIRDGQEATVAAGRIFLCAGAYGSPAVLLRSGIGPADELAALGIPTRLDLPGVGGNLHDHPGVTMSHHGTELFTSLMDDFIADGKTVFTEQSLAKARSSYCDEAFDLHIAPLTAAAPDQNGRWECKMYVALMAPQSRGRLALRDGNPQSNPVIDTGYFTDPGDHDLAALLDGIALTREVARQRPFADLIGQELDETAGMLTAEDLRRNSLHYFHPVGTCKMGPASDPDAVVDPVGRVHGLEGLHVVDASIMPTVPRANTNLPTLMVAERIAAMLH
ncbi:MAG: GMC family oxidoreductase N-terminal domain-containing protein [Chloroflexota bacterium]|nr:GMC family oxidoreductase N-terminal domain-containing protein [Chloroflexota bacterium]MDE2841042.1 GMC family oxidoreductase N-terminal domain-containing protein [Chloroflexota bacterium]MDE2931803.1 GMC family oxidoreductase N-terminal domain-containing protein [Chloroflexota bacterium]